MNMWNQFFVMILTPIVVVLMLLQVLFTTSMTVRVTSTEIQIICGLGYPKRNISVEEILNVIQVGNRGIRQQYALNRRIPNGRNFSMNCRDGVELQFRNGRKCRIGTDEPKQLLAAIQKVMYPD